MVLLLFAIWYFEAASHIGQLVSIEYSSCTLEQETLPSLLSTGYFQERIKEWITFVELLVSESN